MITQITIGDARSSRKTTKLIRRSANEHLYILTSSENRVRELVGTAYRMNLDIPCPITIDEYFRNSDCSRYLYIHGTGLLIDDIGLIFDEIFHDIMIHEMILSDYGNIVKIDDGYPYKKYFDAVEYANKIRSTFHDDKGDLEE